MELDLENPLLSTFHDSIPSLFLIESDHMPSLPQSPKPTEFGLSIRQEAMSLILHLSSNFNDPFLPYLSVNYLDRFLSAQPITQVQPWVVKLTAISCVCLALKMKATEYSVSDIQQSDEGFIFDMETIERMELLILGALQWRMRSITPFSFINFFISLFKFKDPPLVQALKARATEIIFKAQNDIRLLEFRPSIIAASALLSASHELFPLQFPCFRKAISSCSYVNEENLVNCWNLMQEIAMDGYESVWEGVSSSSTPVNVLDIQFCSSTTTTSSDSGKTKNNSSEAAAAAAMAVATVRLERDQKRRKKIGCFPNDNSLLLPRIKQF
ncbi:hypothetical protein RHMOL_Rhmol06G0215900 [Rhododendron molle]|uniref:Uncharacterized protein n=1 Tax=Rhododendron molle TaxID=49168 RepID=A0ACC0NEX3_RHOML|nr:hypothetical protein RHMOL_Rhmol06G0215900 [Rhododendron molle]